MQLMSSIKKLEKAVAVSGSFRGKLTRKSQQSGQIPPGFPGEMPFLPRFGHFLGRPWAVRKLALNSGADSPQRLQKKNSLIEFF